MFVLKQFVRHRKTKLQAAIIKPGLHRLGENWQQHTSQWQNALSVQWKFVTATSCKSQAIYCCKLLHIFSLTLACENIHFSSLFAAWDVSRRGTSATQRQKFHTDDANQCLHNKSGSHGVPNINLSNFTCLLVDFGKFCVHLPTSSSKSQMLLLEKTIFHKHWLFCYRFFVFTFYLCGLLSFVSHS